jgi:hypothetical protein
MGRFARRSNAHYVLRLRPGAEAEAALQRTARTYAEISGWLDSEIPATQSGDLVSRTGPGTGRSDGVAGADGDARLARLGTRRRGVATEGCP